MTNVKVFKYGVLGLLLGFYRIEKAEIDNDVLIFENEDKEVKVTQNYSLITRTGRLIAPLLIISVLPLPEPAPVSLAAWLFIVIFMLSISVRAVFGKGHKGIFKTENGKYVQFMAQKNGESK